MQDPQDAGSADPRTRGRHGRGVHRCAVAHQPPQAALQHLRAQGAHREARLESQRVAVPARVSTCPHTDFTHTFASA